MTIIYKTKVLPPLRHRWLQLVFASLFMSFGVIAPKTLNYLAFQFFDFERTWWRLFQKRIVRTKFDIFIVNILRLLVEQEVLSPPEHLSSTPVFRGIRVTRSLVLCVCYVDR
jgi:hypothetical protein